MNQQTHWQHQQPWYPPAPPKKRGPKLWVIIPLAVVGGFVLLVIIGLTAPKKPAETTATKSDQSIAVTTIPKPDGQQAEDLLYGLRQIDKELDRARSIDRARNTCFDILQGKDKNTVIKNTRYRFDGVASIDNDDARAIVKLIEQGGWCK